MDLVYNDSKIEPDVRDVLGALAIPGIVIGSDEFVYFANDAAKAIFGESIELVFPHHQTEPPSNMHQNILADACLWIPVVLAPAVRG